MDFFVNHKQTIGRYALITLLCLIIVHILSYNKLPFSAGYKFPVLSFFVILTFGFTLCTSNYVLFKKLNISKFYSNKKLQQFYVDFVFHFIVTTLVYTVLYVIINQVVFGFDFLLVNYLKYLFISLLIILFEYVFRKALLTSNAKNNFIDEDVILIKSGNKLLRTKYKDISYFKSNAGLITMKLNQHCSDKTTQFTSLKALIEKLPKDHFFKVNRQYIVNKQCIKTVKNDVNRKLKIIIEPHLEESQSIELSISRYLNSEFKSWYTS